MKALRRSHICSSSSSASSTPASPSSSSPISPSWLHLRSILLIAVSSASPLPDRGSTKVPWSRRKRRWALSHRKWKSLFSPEGRLRDGGVKFLKKARSGGIDPAIRAEVWPFLLGVYDLNSSEAERKIIKTQKRRQYENLRRRCQSILSHNHKGVELLGLGEFSNDLGRCLLDEIPESTEGLSGHFDQPLFDRTPDSRSCNNLDEDEEIMSGITHIDSESSESEFSFEEPEITSNSAVYDTVEPDSKASNRTTEDFATWQRIIRLDALRANGEWIMYSQSQVLVANEKAHRSALKVGLTDFDHLEPCMVYHAARLVAILEAYAIYDPEIGYCQGMSDLLSPILAIIDDDHDAFWCFVGFMKKARHNFRLDEVGIRRQLRIVSKIIQSKDSHLYRHLENLQAEDCFFVYRMVVVLFRRELTFEQTVCLWEVMWADQAAIRAGIRKSKWGRIRVRVPPTDDLLLYAIAACVLQKRKTIIESSSSMDEIMRECNGLAGQLDVWKLLDDAHDLVVTLHDKIE